jgi:hypothetical protein
MWIGCGLAGIGLVPTLADYLPVDLWGLVTDPAGRLHGDRPQVIPVESGVYFPSDVFVGIGLVVLTAGLVLKRVGR